MKVKPIISDEPLRVTPSSPGVASLPSRAGVGMGEAIRGLGSVLARIQEGKFKVESALAAQGGLSEYRTAMEQFFIELDKDPNKAGYVERVKQFSKSKQAEIFGKVKSPNAQEWLKFKFADAAADYEIEARDFENKHFEATKRGEYHEQIYKIAKNAANAPTEAKREEHRKEGKELIKNLEGTILGPEEASIERIKLDKMIEKEQKKADFIKAKSATIQNPYGVEDFIDTYKIPPEKAIYLRDLASRRVARIEKEVEKQKIDTTYLSLKETYGNDYLSMFKALRSSKFQKEHGISGTQADKVDNILKSERATVELERAERHRDTGRKAFILSGRDALTNALIDDAVAKDDMSELQGRYWRDIVINLPDVKTDPEEFVNIRKTVDSAKIETEKDEALKTILTSKKLSRIDKKSLGVRLYPEKDDPMKSPIYKRWMDAFDDAYENDIFGKKKKETSYEEYRMAIDEFERRVKEEKLKGDEIQDLAREMLFPIKESWFKKWIKGIISGETETEEEELAREAKERLGIKEELKEMPPANEHTGRIIRDTDTGKRYRSNGKKWVEVKE